ncbi:MAG: S26 family signal peptidase [Thermosynechococcaceae cyanobacterium]
MGQGQLNRPLAAVPKPKLKEIGLWLCRRRFRLRVVGLSMVPTLYPGDEVLVDGQAYGSSLPTVGDLVVAEHPGQSGLKIVKRVVALTVDEVCPKDSGSQEIAPHYFCTLLGDNPEASTDSRSFGDISVHKLLGKVTSLFYAVSQ